MKKIFLPMFAFATLFLNSCKESEPSTPPNKNYNAISNTFKAIKVIQDNLGDDATKTPAELVDLYNKDIKNNVVKSAQEDFANWIAHIKDNPNGTAEKGKAGKLGKRFLNGNGIEVGQIVKKGFIGAFQLNGFNSTILEVMKAKTKEERKDLLDKAVTFLLGDVSYLDKEKVEKTSHGVTSMQYPVYDGDELAKYMNVVSTSGKYKGIADEIYKTLKETYNYTNNPEKFMVSLLKANKLITTVAAFRGVHYILKSSEIESNLNDGVAHGISEGLGFAYSLQFAYNGVNHKFFLTSEEGKYFTTVNLWGGETTAKELAEKAQKIAGLFGFTTEEAK